MPDRDSNPADQERIRLMSTPRARRKCRIVGCAAGIRLKWKSPHGRASGIFGVAPPSSGGPFGLFPATHRICTGANIVFLSRQFRKLGMKKVRVGGRPLRLDHACQLHPPLDDELEGPNATGAHGGQRTPEALGQDASGGPLDHPQGAADERGQVLHRSLQVKLRRQRAPHNRNPSDCI